MMKSLTSTALQGKRAITTVSLQHNKYRRESLNITPIASIIGNEKYNPISIQSHFLKKQRTAVLCFLGSIAGIMMTLSSTAMALQITNPGFESGNLTGWTSTGSGGNTFATMSYTGFGPTFTAPWNDWFGVVIAGCSTKNLENTFTAKAGETILGWSFFQANEWGSGGFNDSGVVRLEMVDPAGVPTTLFASSVSELGNDRGFTPWTPWEYTFPTDGTYTIKAASTNARDCNFSSAIGIDLTEPGGFVTGGGWIDSPAGAYKPDSTLVGKANYGFVSKYKKGAVVPTGNTEFNFQAGNLNFHSDSYDWLVVNKSGTNAQFKGDGAVNGVPGYTFMIWAQDNNNSPDTFRIKIWNATSVVYDNGVDSILGGGNNVIHLK